MAMGNSSVSIAATLHKSVSARLGRPLEPTGSLVSQLAGELGRRWQAGERPLVEEYFARHAELGRQTADALRLICEEMCLRQEHGADIPREEFLGRFPTLRTELEVLLDCHSLLAPDQGPTFPTVGERVGDFALLRELGRGGQGQVFLATQPALADRPVVLKVTPQTGHEHLSLARLQHTYIVPLYLAQDDAERRLRILCMPYFGGMSLADLLKDLGQTPLARRTGQDVLRTLDREQALLPLPATTQGPARQFFARASYVQVICSIGACLADALQYAHERGLVHLDLKPANVLLAADGQPMLLDFHLARQPIVADGPAIEWLGGTMVYMSPEQRAAVEAVSAGRPVIRAVDERSDVYSLGLVLHDALGGPAPPATGPAGEGAPRQRLDRLNTTVSVGLADIVDKCLRPDPAQRYASAAALAADLRRHLNHQLLQGVPNRSWAERWRKWRRRRPQALAAALVFLLVGAVLAGAAAVAVNQYRQQVARAGQALEDGRARLRAGDFAEATRLLNAGLEQLRDLPKQEALAQTINEELVRVRQAQLTQQLHHLADQVRWHYDADSLAPERLQTLARACAAIWAAREELRPVTAEADARAEQLRTDFLDVAILGAALRVRLAASADPAEARRAALAVLREAESMFGASPALYRERLAHAQALGLTELVQQTQAAAAQSQPRTAWDHDALGRLCLRAGDFPGASAHFEEAVRLQPQSFWPYFYQGTGAFRAGQPAMAASAFRVCVALAPTKPECWYNRGLAYQAMNQLALAAQDYTRALELDPTLAAAAFNRGVIHHHEQRYRDAMADLHQALANGIDPALAHYHLALSAQALKERAAALEHVQQALKHRADFKEAKDLLDRLKRER